MGKISFKSVRNLIIVLLIPVVCFGLLKIMAPTKISSANIPSLISQTILPAILGLGLVFNIGVGNWDFAIGAEFQLAAILGGNLAQAWGLGVGGMVVLCLLFGTIFGAINGSLYLLLRVPTLITSVGFLLILESICSIVYHGNGYRGSVKLLVLGTFPQNYLIFLVAFLAIYFIYNYRPFGSHVKAVGKNPVIAELNGINVIRTKFLSIFTAGIFAGIYAFMYLGTNTSIRNVGFAMGTMGTAFDGMMCVFIGMSLSSMVNLIFGVFIGALLLNIIKLGLIVLNAPTEMSQVIIVLFVLAFMAYSGIKEKRRKPLIYRTGQQQTETEET